MKPHFDALAFKINSITMLRDSQAAQIKLLPTYIHTYIDTKVPTHILTYITDRKLDKETKQISVEARASKI